MKTRPPKRLGREFDKVISVLSEGRVTEPSYLAMLNNLKENNRIEVVMKGSENIKNMNKVRNMLDKLTQREKLPEIWIVLDINDNTPRQLTQFCDLKDEENKLQIAFSNPCFEVWLLFHFEDANEVRDSSNSKSAKAMCLQRLKSLPRWENFTKEVKPNMVPPENIYNAIKRAEKFDKSQNRKWPEKYGATTFHKLVKSFLDMPP